MGGSPSKNTTSAAHPLSTENASKYFRFVAQLKHFFLFKKSGVNFNLQHSKIQNFKILFFFVKCKFKLSFGINLPIWHKKKKKKKKKNSLGLNPRLKKKKKKKS